MTLQPIQNEGAGFPHIVPAKFASAYHFTGTVIFFPKRLL
jgi:hypothetical protein